MYLNHDHPFNMSLTQLKMVSDNIMVDFKNKYELWKRLNAPNLRREKAERGPGNERRDASKEVEQNYRGEATTKAYYLKRLVIPIREELK